MSKQTGHAEFGPIPGTISPMHTDNLLQCLEFWKHIRIPWACAECDDSLPFSGASSVLLCYVPFPATLLHQLFFHPLSSCHLFLGLTLNLVVPLFIYNTLLGILFSSILCTCPNQHNLFNLIVSTYVGKLKSILFLFDNPSSTNTALLTNKFITTNSYHN